MFVRTSTTPARVCVSVDFPGRALADEGSGIHCRRSARNPSFPEVGLFAVILQSWSCREAAIGAAKSKPRGPSQTQNSRVNTRTLSLITSFCALAWAVPGVAAQQGEGQTAPPAAETGDAQQSDIIVTGAARAQRRFDVPYAINSLGQEEIERIAPKNFADLLGTVPGIHVEARVGAVDVSHRYPLAPKLSVRYWDGNAHRLKQNSAGFLMGVDAIADEAVQLGAFGGYQQGDADVRAVSSEANIDTYHAGVYAGAELGALGLRAGHAFSWHEADVTRRIAFGGLSDVTTGRFEASTAQAFAEIGYRLDFGTSRVEPFAQIAQIWVDGERMNEAGGAAALQIAHSKISTGVSTLGARLDQSFSLGSLEASLKLSAGWRHAFNDRLPVTTSRFEGASLLGSPAHQLRVTPLRQTSVLAWRCPTKPVSIFLTAETSRAKRSHMPVGRHFPGRSNPPIVLYATRPITRY